MTNINKHFQAGVTLMELMVVIAIVGIIFSMALPSYRNYVIRTQRIDAQACLIELSHTLERRYAGSSKYTSAVAFKHNCITRTADFYTITSILKDHSYTLKASPTSNQPDWACGVLTYNNTHQKGLEASSASGSSVTGTVAKCWQG